MESYTTAGQFQVQGGQLVELISAPGAAVELLYANVIPNETVTTKLAVTFSGTKNSYGTFAWSGDALTWTNPNVKRQNNAAWLACTGQQLFINLGAYGYQTPSGCADQTVYRSPFLTALSESGLWLTNAPRSTTIMMPRQTTSSGTLALLNVKENMSAQVYCFVAC